MQNVLRVARFEECKVQDRAIGAGIVPVAVRPDGSIVLLLAREQHIHNWKGSCKWSGFEGGRKQNESIEDTACREWREESLSTIPGVEEALRNGSYVCRYTLNILQNRPQLVRATESDRYHVTYAVEVPYSDDYIDAFKMKRDQLMQLHDAAVAWQQCRKETMNSESILEMQLHSCEECCVYLSSRTIRSRSPHDESMRNILQTHSTLCSAVSRLGYHESVYVHYSPNHVLLDVFINKDFLEKDCIAWWTLPDARSVLQNGGRFEDQSFRTYFLPVLLGIVSHMEALNTATCKLCV